jgi:hypothetical protein
MRRHRCDESRILLDEPMKRSLILAACFLVTISTFADAQPNARDKRRGGPTPADITDHPQAIGEAGIDWYTTWETGLAEAKRSNRPIFFMSAATTCNGISGVF